MTSQRQKWRNIHRANWERLEAEHRKLVKDKAYTLRKLREACDHQAIWETTSKVKPKYLKRYLKVRVCAYCGLTEWEDYTILTGEAKTVELGELSEITEHFILPWHPRESRLLEPVVDMARQRGKPKGE